MSLSTFISDKPNVQIERQWERNKTFIKIWKPKIFCEEKVLFPLGKMKSNILIQVKATQNTLFMSTIKMFVLKRFVCWWSQSTECEQPTEYSATSFVSILNCISRLLIRLHLHWCIFLSPILLTVVLHLSQKAHKSGKPQECHEKRVMLSLWQTWGFSGGTMGLRGQNSVMILKKIFLRIAILF